MLFSVRLLAAALLLILAGCGDSPHEAGLTWRGKPLRVVERIDAPPRDSLTTLGWEALVNHAPRRILRVEPGEWGDTLWLLEFENDVQAYTAYQQVSPDAESVILGETVCGARVCFRRGRWIGAVDAWSWKGGEWFAQALALPDAPVPGGMPDVFGSLLHQDRLAGSERVLTGEFMGLRIDVPVFAFKAVCRSDTAWVYASPGLKPEFADSVSRQSGWSVDTLGGFRETLEVYSELTDLPPVILRFSGGGMVGAEGCFDKELTNFWLKMQARGLKKLK